MMDQSGELKTLPLEDILKTFKTNPETGLTQEEARFRLEKQGLNVLPEKKSQPYRDFFISQIKDPVVLILLAAALIKYFTSSLQDALAIFFVIVLNTSIGLLHQRKALKAMSALKKLMNPIARVMRSGQKLDIPTSELVTGDIIFLESGMKVPADARLIESFELLCDESMLTGESLPAAKNHIAQATVKSPVQDLHHSVFSGTIVTKGRAKACVVGTGAHTEIGKIAASLSSIDDSPSPLQQRLSTFSKKLTLGIVCLIFTMGVIGYLRGYPISELFLMAVSLIVSAIPEALPLAVTMCLIIGVQKMAEKNALVKKLASVETLGSCDVICSDKTGTLTCNQMTSTCLVIGDKLLKVTGSGYDHHGHIEGHADLLMLGLNAAHNHETTLIKKEGHWIVQGDPTEAALIVLSKKIPCDLHVQKVKLAIPFESENRYMATLVEKDQKAVLFIKGAIDKVLNFCDKMQDASGHVLPIDKKLLESKASHLSNQALRVIALAYIPLKSFSLPHKLEGGVLSALVGLEDPLREHIHDMVKHCDEASIQVKMITGDHPHTAHAIYKQLKGEAHYKLLKGIDIDEMDPQVKKQELVSTNIFARVSPHNKLEIVQALKEKGHIVAMTGDGVNDSPSLKGSDIGIAMGSGSDVAKETATMILLDDNFSTIVKAIEMGRMIFITLQNLIMYLLMTALSGVLTLCLAIFLGWPLPLQPIQLLWINLVTDGSTTVPMVFEKLRPSLMKRPPCKKDAPIIEKSRLYQMLTLSAYMALGTLGAFYFSYFIRKDTLVQAQTIAFTTLACFQIFNTQNARSKDEPCLLSFSFRGVKLSRLPLSFNVPLLFTMIAALLLQTAAVEISWLQPYLQTISLTFKDWQFILPLTFSIIICSDVYKWFRFIKNTK